MDNLILELERLNHSVIENLQEIPYEKLVEFTELRQDVVEKMMARACMSPLNTEQKHRISEIVATDSLIRNRMETLKEEASKWLQQRGLAKTRRNAYEVTYNLDSVLMDQRK